MQNVSHFLFPYNERNESMKRLLFLIPLIALLTSCGNTANATAPDMDISFSAEADIAYGDNECTVQMRRFSENCWEFCVTEPYALEGAVIRIEDGKTTVSMFDTEALADINGEAVSVTKLITDAVEAAITDSANATEKDGVITLKGQSPTSAYTLSFGADKRPALLSMEEKDVKVEFTKFVPMEKGEEDVTPIE